MTAANRETNERGRARETIEQKRAKNAWDCAKNGIDKHGKDYVNDAKGLPALIMNSGLMQVMAFLEQKGGRHAFLGEQLRRWIHERFPQIPEKFAHFMEELFSLDSRTYQAVTAESFAWLKWLRQMAAARQKGD